LRIVVRTSDVTHLRNFFASGLFGLKINAYSPDSLTIIIPRLTPGILIPLFDELEISLSSKIVGMLFVFVPSTSQVSFAINHGSPFAFTVQ
jgi:hypothetical protein